MVEKLYYVEPYVKEFQANIISVREKDNTYHIELNKTAFYPEGGGQPADTGTIAGINVIDVYKEDNRIFHVLERLPVEKVNVNCKIDWERRFDHMQQHTGQHMLSAVLHNDYEAETVGFHLGEDYVSIDINKIFTAKDLNNIETKVNRLIFDNLKIEIIYPDQRELDNLKLRKEPAVEQNVRIVKIGEIDLSPCGGTHLSQTGELGMLKIIEAAYYKGGMRIKFLCGMRALKDYHNKNNIVAGLKDFLSVKNEDIVGEVTRLREVLKEKDKKIKELNDIIINYRSKSLMNSAEVIKGVKVIKRVFSNGTFNNIRLLAAKITSENSAVVIFGHKDKSAARLILSCSGNLKMLKMNEIIKTPLELINGKGGGNLVQAQGGGSNIKNLEKAVREAYNEIIQILKEGVNS